MYLVRQIHQQIHFCQLIEANELHIGSSVGRKNMLKK